MLISVGPNLPGLAYSINSNSKITDGAKNLYTFDWLFGFTTSIFLYTVLSLISPHKSSQIPTTVYGYDLDGQEPGSSDIESTGVRHEKDFGNVDAVDLNSHHHGNEKNIGSQGVIGDGVLPDLPHSHKY